MVQALSRPPTIRFLCQRALRFPLPLPASGFIEEPKTLLDIRNLRIVQGEKPRTAAGRKPPHFISRVDSNPFGNRFGERYLVVVGHLGHGPILP